MRKLVIFLMIMTSLGLMAQEGNKKRQEVDYDSPTFVPMVKVGKVLESEKREDCAAHR